MIVIIREYILIVHDSFKHYLTTSNVTLYVMLMKIET